MHIDCFQLNRVAAGRYTANLMAGKVDKECRGKPYLSFAGGLRKPVPSVAKRFLSE